MNLNELLEQKASERLNADIETFLQSIREHKLFKGINNKNIRLEDNESQTIQFFFWGNSTAAKMIREHFIEEYKATEANNFMQKVDALESELEGLKTIQQ